MNTWKPGQRAMVEVDVIEGDTGDGLVMFGVTTDPPWQVRGSIPADLLLLPVSAPDADTIERARKVIGDHVNLCACGHDASGEHNSLGCYARLSYEPLVKCDCKRDHGDGTTTEVIARALAAAGLLAVREPGRSEAEIKAEALQGALDDIKARIVTFRSLDAHNEYMNALNDAWSLVANRARAVQVTGTEGGETRG